VQLVGQVGKLLRKLLRDPFPKRENMTFGFYAYCPDPEQQAKTLDLASSFEASFEGCC
jgi:hypothetical protein